MLPTLWKPEIVPPPAEFNCNIEPIGHPQVVVSMLLSINGMRPSVERAFHGYVGCQWKDVMLLMREEPEFGPGGVFSIMVEGTTRTMDFYLLYVQAHELLGVVLLDGDEFLTTRELRRRLP